MLERAEAPIGIVTGIVGQARGEVVFEGRADHAGTTPMDARDDALVKAAEFVLDTQAAAADGAVATIGRIRVDPGAVNVVPARVTLSVDARAPSSEQLHELIAAIGFAPSYRTEPVAMAEAALAALREAAPDAPELVSGAGHDCGMLFVRSLNGGASHSPNELSSGDDIARAVDVLQTAAVRIAG